MGMGLATVAIGAFNEEEKNKNMVIGKGSANKIIM